MASGVTAERGLYGDGGKKATGGREADKEGYRRDAAQKAGKRGNRRESFDFADAFDDGQNTEDKQRGYKSALGPIPIARFRFGKWFREVQAEEQHEDGPGCEQSHPVNLCNIANNGAPTLVTSARSDGKKLQDEEEQPGGDVARAHSNDPAAQQKAKHRHNELDAKDRDGRQ